MSSALRSQSDSEDDADYIPPAREELSSDSDDEARSKKQPVGTPGPSIEDAENKQKDRDALWASFQASVASSSGQRTEKAEEKRMVKVQKKYLFAGEYITEVIEVPEDSPDAKKWPLYREGEAQIGCRRSPSAQHETPSTITTPPLSITMETGPAPTPKPPLKKPGPRKPKTVLSAVPSSSSQKAKKLTTLDKSVMDWEAHTQDTKLQEELEANRKGGGYLEKVEFLQRVEDRKEENLEAMKSRKRRKL